MPDDDFPGPTPGPELEQLRKSLGIRQKDLAQRLGVGRITLHGWERSAEVDPLRTARYRRALREIVTEATEGVA
jgi:DNA-binding transcriptional regulator YiaG